MVKTITLFLFLFMLPLASLYAQEDFQVHFKNQAFLPKADNIPSAQTLPVFGGRRYGLIQFQAIPSDEHKKALQLAGVELLDYIPNLTWFFSSPVGVEPAQLISGVRSIFSLLPAQKMDEAILNRKFPNWAVKEGGKLDVNILLYRKNDTQNQTAFDKISQSGGRILAVQEPFQSIQARINPGEIDALASEPWLQWIEPVSPDAVKENLPGKNLHRSSVLEYGIRNLTGSGVNVAIWDGGEVGNHLDFSGRLSLEETSAPDNHASHVMGTIGGAGLLDPGARGMAPASTLFSYDFGGSIPTEMTTAIPAKGLIVTSHSYGYGDAFVNCTNGDPYNSNSRSQDLVLVNFPNVMHVHSSGNSQAVCTGGWKTTTGKAAKNMLVVANGTVNEAISGSSSFGPVQDGRLKPEITGMGTGVFSTTPGNSYMTMSGTSMATPGVSGTIAQLYQRYRQLNAGADPRSALMKALVCNTAKDRGNAGPDYRFGYGTINGLKAVRAMEANRYEVNSIANGGTYNKTITVPANTAQIRVMIAWLDPAAAANANPALINNLNLTVTDPGATVFNPWILDPANPANAATRGVDTRNNIEQVTIANPAAGDYTITINGASVPSGPQQYALTWEFDNNGIEIIYPNGGEILQPGTNAGLIFWDSYGVTANQTIEYSTNNGTNWTSLGTVGSTVNAVSWTVPATISNQYLMRVTQGALTDQSDATFTVIGTPTGLSLSQGCNVGDLVLNWTAVTGATQYDVMKLDTVTYAWNVFAADVVGTSYTATGLSTTQRHWFSVRAKANALSVIGQRCAAVVTTGQHVNPFSINVVADATSGCAPLNTVLRTVVPANSYTATNPAFSTISGTPTNITSWTGNADDGFAQVALPFSFKFYNTDYNSVFVSTNGFITFGAGSAANAPNAFPTGTAPNNVIALCFADLNLTSSGTCGTFISGTAPNRRFVIQYDNAPPYSGTGTLSGQIVLFEGSNLIEMNISSQNLSGSKTQGVENVNGSAATTIAGRNNANWTATNDSRRFTPILSGATYAWSPGTALSSTVVQNPTVSNLNTSVSYSVTVNYNGCVGNGNVTLTVTNVPAQPGVITGSASVCQGNTPSYSIASVSGATSYNWSLPGDWTGTSSTTSISPTVGANSGTISVAAVNGCGPGTARTLAVTTFTSVPPQPGGISGNIAVCSGSSQPYSITAVAGATSYAWTLPSGWSGSSTTTNISTTPSANSGNVVVSASNACGAGADQTLAVSASAIPAQPGIISGTTPVCNGSTNTYSIASVAGATSYNWNLPSGWTGTSSTESINATASANSGNISVTASNFCGTGPVRNLAVTAVSIPILPGTITGLASVCNGSTHTYSIGSVAGATAYVWNLPAGWSGTSTTTSISATASANSGDITVAAENFCGTGPERTLAVTVTSIPAQPGAITGNTDICSGSGQTYSISAVSGATSYTWTLPSGWTGTSTTTSISPTASANSGNVSVRANNSCGNSTFEQLAVTVTSIPAQPGIISGTTPICNGSTNSYSIASVAGATSYNWTLPSGWTGTSSTESINATASANSGNISVTASNFCGTGPVRNLAVTAVSIPNLPGTITGLASVCNGSTHTYSIGSVAGATAYVWTLPSGWSGTSTTTSISATASANSGDITVAAENSCGTGPERTLAVTVTSIPAQPGAISGNTDICSGSGQTYSISAVSGATSYTWTLPSGWTGTSTTTSISPTASANSGNVSVRANNSCGNSTFEQLAVTVTSIPAQPGIISGTTPICNGSTNSYSIASVAGATSYNWSLPSGWTGTSSTESINATASANSGNISVTAENTCGSSLPRNFAVTAVSIPDQPGTISGAASVCAGSNQVYSIAAVSGATGYTWNLPGDWIGSSSSTAIAATAGTLGGNIQVTANNACGSSAPENVSVSILTIPGQPGTITGPGTVVSGIPTGYSISAVAGATGYVWGLPPGWSGSSIITGITVTPNVISGNLTVAAQNSCGTGPSQTLFIIATDPGSGLEINNWLGVSNTPVGNNWQNPSNWSAGTVPTASQLARILNGTPFAPQISVVVLAGGIALEGGAQVQFTNSAARLQVAGDWKGNPGQVNGPGNVEFIGNQIQTIQGNTIFQNLFVQKSGGQLQVSGQARVKGIMQFDNASANLTILPGGELIFHSDLSGTGKLGPVPNGMTISGNVTTERALTYPAGSLGNWFFMASPIQGKNFADWADDFYMAAPGGSYCGVQAGIQTISNVEHSTIFKYVEALHHVKTDNVQKIGWRIPDNENIIPGMGYRVWVKKYNNPSGKFTNRGPVTYGSFTFPTLTRNHFSPCFPTLPSHPQDECNEAQRGWNLLANPYPCDINWDSPGWTKPAASEMGNAFYTWNNLAPGYGFYSGGSYLGVTPAPANPHIIPSGQAFFVRINNPGTQTLQISESAKITNASGQFIRKAVQVQNQLQIHLGKNLNGNTNEYGFDVMVRFAAEATHGFDPGLDFASLGGSRFQMAIPVENQNLVMSTFGELNEMTVVPLHTQFGTEWGTYSFSFSHLNSFSEGTLIFLKDKVNQTMQLINENPLVVFQVYAMNGLNNSDRFELIFSPSVLGVGTPKSAEDLVVFPNPSLGQIRVFLPENEGTVKLELVNELGQIFSLGEKSFSGLQFEIGLTHFPSGVYQLHVQGKNKTWKRKLVKI